MLIFYNTQGNALDEILEQTNQQKGNLFDYSTNVARIVSTVPVYEINNNYYHMFNYMNGTILSALSDLI